MEKAVTGHAHIGLREPHDPHENTLVVKVELLDVANFKILEARSGDPTKNPF